MKNLPVFLRAMLEGAGPLLVRETKRPRASIDQRTGKDHRANRRRGVDNPKAKLTADQVEEIRSAPRPERRGHGWWEASTRRLAARYGVHESTIRKIRGGQRWAA